MINTTCFLQTSEQNLRELGLWWFQNKVSDLWVQTVKNGNKNMRCIYIYVQCTVYDRAALCLTQANLNRILWWKVWPWNNLETQNVLNDQSCYCILQRASSIKQNCFMTSNTDFVFQRKMPSIHLKGIQFYAKKGRWLRPPAPQKFMFI